MKRLACLFALLIVCAPPGRAAAQETRGSIEGVVRDASGGVLPGTTVEARSPRLVGVQSTTTDTNGVYRFPALPPGAYEVTGTLQGSRRRRSRTSSSVWGRR